MSLNCNNVQDYVSLYKDDALSEATTSEINEHISECKECKKFYKEYDGMNTTVPELETVINEDADYAAIAKKIRKKKNTTSLFTVIGMLAVVAGTAYFTHWLFHKDEK